MRLKRKVENLKYSVDFLRAEVRMLREHIKSYEGLEDNLTVKGETMYRVSPLHYTGIEGRSTMVNTPEIPVTQAVKEIMDYLGLEIETSPASEEESYLVEKTT